MRWQFVTRFLSLSAVGAVAAGLCVVLGSGTASAHDKADEAMPEPPVRMQLLTPSATGPWLMRVDNHGEQAVRIVADVRMLSFVVKTPATKKGKRRRRARTETCNGPKAFRLERHFPADRQLVLLPGESYVEQFDPRLICFGKQAKLLVPGAKVTAKLGWKPNKRRRRMSSAPFAADDAASPRQFRPLRRLKAEEVTLDDSPPVVYGNDVKGRSEGSGAAKGGDAKAGTLKPDQLKPDQLKKDGKRGVAADKKPPGDEPATKQPATGEPKRSKDAATPDALGARLALTASHYADARRPTEIVLSVQAHNAGQRPLFIAVRDRMLSFAIEGPNGPVKCSRPSVRHKVPRDLFRQLHHGKHVHMNVLLAEVCPPGTFDRPGLYVATPTLHVDASGTEYGLTAAVGTVTTSDRGDVGGTHEARDDATLVRVKQGRKPFYNRPPRSLPTRILPN
jgi:hypothetical protein